MGAKGPRGLAWVRPGSYGTDTPKSTSKSPSEAPGRAWPRRLPTSAPLLLSGVRDFSSWAVCTHHQPSLVNPLILLLLRGKAAIILFILKKKKTMTSFLNSAHFCPWVPTGIISCWGRMGPAGCQGSEAHPETKSPSSPVQPAQVTGHSPSAQPKSKQTPRPLQTPFPTPTAGVEGRGPRTGPWIPVTRGTC